MVIGLEFREEYWAMDLFAVGHPSRSKLWSGFCDPVDGLIRIQQDSHATIPCDTASCLVSLIRMLIFRLLDKISAISVSCVLSCLAQLYVSSWKEHNFALKSFLSCPLFKHLLFLVCT